MKYKQGKRFGLPHEEQSFLYFYCLGYEKRKPEERKIISDLCYEVGGAQYSEAVFTAVTSSERLLDVAVDYDISESQLYRMVKDFYDELSCSMQVDAP